MLSVRSVGMRNAEGDAEKGASQAEPGQSV